MTYRRLLKALSKLSPQQLDCDVTVELGVEEECFPAEFRIADVEHYTLDDNHPIIFVP
jgi:hypothetical protein